MTREELLQAVRDLVVAATSLDPRRVIEYQPPGKGVRPSLPYIAVHLLTPGRAMGRAGGELTTTENPDGTFVRPVTGQREATVSLSAYGTGSYDLLEAFRNVRTHDALLELQASLEVAVRVVGDVIDNTVNRDGTRFEPQANCTVTIGYTHTSNDAVAAIGTIAVCAPDGSDLDVADFDFEVTHGS